jgi:ribosomal protein S27E
MDVRSIFRSIFMKFKVIADIQGNFMLEERAEDFEIACPFCENIDIYHVEEDTDLYCSKCGKLLVIKGKGRTCFDFEDVTKLKNIIKRGTAREDRRNALILLGRVLEWCEDLTLAEFLLHLSLMDPDKWVRDRAEQILNQQREAGTAKVKSEIKKLKTSQKPPPVSKVMPLSEEKEETFTQDKIPVEDLSGAEEIPVQKEDLKKANLVDILLEVIDDTEEKPYSSTNRENSDNIDELLEVAMGSIESTKDVLENTSESVKKIKEEIKNEMEYEIKEEIKDETEDEIRDEMENEDLSEHKSITEDIDDITAQELLDKPIEDLLDGINIESLLEEFTLTEDFNEKADILFIMGEMKFIDSIEFLLDLMKNDPDYELRLISLQALEKIGDKTIAPAILDAMKKEKDADFRKKIANFYSQLKYKSEG